MGRLGVLWQRKASARPDKKQALPVLRHAVMGGIQHPVLVENAITVLPEFRNDLIEKLPVRADSEAANILEYEI